MQEETCALLESGRVRCWGFNGTGQLGTPRAGDVSAPATVPSITGARDIATSGGHTCAVLASGQVKCWGKNSSGQLGNGTLTDSVTPVTVQGLPLASAVAVDPAGYSCALARTGKVYCWGHNPKNQLGNKRFPDGSGVPVQTVGVSHAVAITTAVGHACALLSSGGAECWGYDDYGQLGDGARPPLVRNATPVAF
jgi:alpha-tubulin suppressor-like RCC1 family protein